MARDLERQALAVLLGSGLATLLLSARNGLAPLQSPWSFGLVFWLCFAILYALAGALLLASYWIAARLLSRPRLPSLALRAQALVFVAAAAWSNRGVVRELGALPEPARFQWLCPAGLTLAALGLLALALLPRRPLVARGLSLLALSATLGALAPADAGPAETAIVAAGSAGKPKRPAERLLVLGIDGADWQYMKPLMERGELPHLAALKGRGAWGRLQTLRPTVSPRVWTSVVTGKPPEEHGILSFTITRLAGLAAPLPELRPVGGVGFGLLERELRRREIIAEGAVTSSARRVPAYWNIASGFGTPTMVLNWWATWPAETLLGSIVSERAFYFAVEARGKTGDAGVTFPAALYPEVKKLVMRPDQVSLELSRPFMDVSAEEWTQAGGPDYTVRRGILGEFPYFYALFESTRRISALLIERGRAEFGAPPDFFVLFRLIDMTCHTSLQFSELVADRTVAPDAEALKYARVVSEAYRAVDRALGEILGAWGEGNVLVLSDHGFEVMVKDGLPRYAHHNKAPDGVFIGAGPAFQPGRVGGLKLADVMPLLLYLKGFPLAEDMRGRLPEEAIRPERLAAHPVRRIASYGTRRAAGWVLPEDPGVDAEMIERLKALGYLK